MSWPTWLSREDLAELDLSVWKGIKTVSWLILFSLSLGVKIIYISLNFFSNSASLEDFDSISGIPLFISFKKIPCNFTKSVMLVFLLSMLSIS